MYILLVPFFPQICAAMETDLLIYDEIHVIAHYAVLTKHPLNTWSGYITLLHCHCYLI